MKHATRKETAQGKAETIARKARRRAKTMGLKSWARIRSTRKTSIMRDSAKKQNAKT